MLGVLTGGPEARAARLQAEAARAAAALAKEEDALAVLDRAVPDADDPDAAIRRVLDARTKLGAERERLAVLQRAAESARRAAEEAAAGARRDALRRELEELGGAIERVEGELVKPFRTISKLVGEGIAADARAAAVREELGVRGNRTPYFDLGRPLAVAREALGDPGPVEAPTVREVRLPIPVRTK